MAAKQIQHGKLGHKRQVYHAGIFFLAAYTQVRATAVDSRSTHNAGYRVVTLVSVSCLYVIFDQRGERLWASVTWRSLSERGNEAVEYRKLTSRHPKH